MSSIGRTITSIAVDDRLRRVERGEVSRIISKWDEGGPGRAGRAERRRGEKEREGGREDRVLAAAPTIGTNLTRYK